MAEYDRMSKVLVVTLSPVSVAANTCAEQALAVPGVAAGDTVVAIKPASQAGLGVSGARVSALDTVAVNFCNNTGSPIVPTASEAWKFVVVRP